MRRFSFNIDLRKDKSGKAPSKPRQSQAPAQADGFQMSGDLAEKRQFLRAWPGFQKTLMGLPEVVDTTEPWEDPNLAAEYVRIYQVSLQKVLDAEPGFHQLGKTETHCFFGQDGTKHLVSRLLSRPHHRLNETRLSQDGQIARLYYENTGERLQSLDDLFERGLLGLEDDEARFARYPEYVMRFFLLVTQGDLLASTFRGVCYFDPESGGIVTQEAESLTG